MKRFLTAAGIAALAATPLMAADEHMIEKIDVTFDLQSVESPTAAEFWADLEGDLEEAIAAKVTDRIAEEGSVVTIDIDEFDMSNTFQGALGVDSVLLGHIEVKNEADPTKNTYYDLKVTVDESGSFETGENGVEIVAHDREKVYAAVVDTFATGVVERLR
jgi:hypothetical protein